MTTPLHAAQAAQAPDTAPALPAPEAAPAASPVAAAPAGAAAGTAHADAGAPACPSPARGHHWLLDLSDCGCDAPLLQQADVLREWCLRACRDAGMTVVGDAFHQFTPHGVTGVVLLAESHLSIHTWPEVAFAAVDVYVCDHERGNAARGQALAHAIEQALRPRRAQVRDVERRSVAPVLAA